MTTPDLLTHMLKFVLWNEDKQSASLVCNGWNEVSDTQRKPRRHVTAEDVSHLALIQEK